MEFKEFAIMPAIATLFDSNEEFDPVSQKKLVRFLLKKGVDGFYIGASTGEGFMMGTEDRKRVMSEIISEAGSGVYKIAYVGSIDTKTAAELAKYAEKEGADAVSSVPPYYYSFNWAEIKRYYKALSESVGIPLIMYNNSLSGLMGFNDILDGLNLPNCGGIKYTAHNHYEMKMIKVRAADKLVFSGADEMFASAMVSGVDGAIGLFYNIVPELYMKMRQVFSSDIKEFMRLSEASVKIVAAYMKYSFIPGMKATIEFMGHGKRYLRSPKAFLSDDEFSALKKELKEIKDEYQLDFVELFDLI